MTLPPPPPYARLARSIVDGRTARGLSQGDLAQRLGVRQQSVSRWEAGTHRPGAGQIDALGAAIEVDSASLRILADYAAPAGVSFVKPLPVDRLDPETFEQFAAVLIQEIRPDLDVRRSGASGHTQAGADVEAYSADGQLVLMVQCKRAAQFGPAQVDAVVAAFTGEADTKLLMLSRVASPQTAARLRTYPGWRLWDKDDINRRFRKLSPVQQELIVDTFFRGQTLELLGRAPAGPWMDTERFFRPFHQPDALFTHDWVVEGRQPEMAELQGLMADPKVPLTVLSAAGGMGKSRLLLEAARALATASPATQIFFLSTTAELTRADMAALGVGSKVVIVDDAHDRDALGVLFEYAADRETQTRLVLATRPYARQRLLREASIFGLKPAMLTLEPLKSEALESLAEHMLTAAGETPAWADQVVAISGGSPLILSMAVRSLAREPMAPERVRSQEELRQFVLGKFRKVVEGRLGSSADPAAQLKVLEVLALAQPFHPEDKQLVELIVKVQDLPTADIERILGSLVEGGVALRRGPQHRLMPDVLGDYLIDESCLAGDQLSHFASSVLAAAPPRLLVNAVINLGRLDWRRTDGDTSRSRLLADVWRSFETIDNDYDERLSAIRTLSVFQPHQALRFVAHLLKRGVALSSVPEFLRNIAYTADCLPQAINLLWDLGRTDERKTGPHPNHPIRVFAEMAGFADEKPLEVSEALAAFALEQADRSDVWDGAYTPIDLLEPFLATEGFRNRSTGRGITFAPYELNYDYVRPWRARVIDKLFDLLRRPERRISRLAALAFQNVLRAPIGLFGSLPSEDGLQAYDREMIDTMGRLAQILADGLEPIPALGVAASVSWHADHGDATRAAAQAVLDALPRTLEFRTYAALADGFGNLFLDRADSRKWPENVKTYIDAVTVDLETALPVPGDRLAHIDALMSHLEAAGDELNSAHILVQALSWSDRDFARALVAQAEISADPPTARFAPGAAQAIRDADPEEGYQIIMRWLTGAREELRRSAANILFDRFENVSPAEVLVVRRMLIDDNPDVVHAALRAVWSWRPPEDVLLDLVFSARLEDPGVLEQAAMIIGGPRGDLLDRVSDERVALFLAAAEPIPVLNGHWTNETLAVFSRTHPAQTAEFFRNRVERAVAAPFEFRPANYGAWARARLEFNQSDLGAEILGDTWDWLRRNWDRGFEFQYPATHLFDAMFLGDPDALVAFFSSRIATAGPLEVEVISALLREVHFRFVLDRTDFIFRFLDRCAEVDPEAVERASQRLYGAATSGMYSGMPGEPMPRDLETLTRCQAILDQLSPMSPAWELYDWIREHAVRNIERSRHEGEMMDD